MITIRAGKYTQVDAAFVAKVINNGLDENCYNYREEMKPEVCEDCPIKISCKELQSAMHHMLAVKLEKQAKALSEENKTL